MKAGGRDSQLFIVSPAAFAAATEEEVKATVEGLRECGLYHLPYDTMNLRVPLDSWGTITFPPGKEPKQDGRGRTGLVPTGQPGQYKFAWGPHHQIELRGLSLQPGKPFEFWVVHDGGDPTFKPYEEQDDKALRRTPEQLEFVRQSACDFLITLLATSNAAKEVTHNKRVRLGIGTGKVGSTGKYEYVTRIDVPPAAAVLEHDEAHPPTGRTVCPHLRRGHPKRVRYGVGRQQVRVQWIAPCFVNADRDWVRSRKAYTLTHTAP
jgi:hypothetical protein